MNPDIQLLVNSGEMMKHVWMNGGNHFAWMNGSEEITVSNGSKHAAIVSINFYPASRITNSGTTIPEKYEEFAGRTSLVENLLELQDSKNGT